MGRGIGHCIGAPAVNRVVPAALIGELLNRPLGLGMPTWLTDPHYHSLERSDREADMKSIWLTALFATGVLAACAAPPEAELVKSTTPLVGAELRDFFAKPFVMRFTLADTSGHARRQGLNAFEPDGTYRSYARTEQENVDLFPNKVMRHSVPEAEGRYDLTERDFCLFQVKPTAWQRTCHRIYRRGVNDYAVVRSNGTPLFTFYRVAEE